MFRKFMQGFIALLLIAGVTATFGQGSSTNTATWSWVAPTQYVDGTPIPAGTVITFELFTGSASKGEATTPVWTGTALTTVTSGYTSGTSVYGYVEACVNGLCSAPSSEASKSFPLPALAAPSNLTVQ